MSQCLFYRYYSALPDICQETRQCVFCSGGARLPAKRRRAGQGNEDAQHGKARAASRIACLHANVPNMIGQITAILAHDNANVQRMVNESAGENAYTMFDTDEHLESKTIEALKEIPAVYRVRVIK